MHRADSRSPAVAGQPRGGARRQRGGCQQRRRSPGDEKMGELVLVGGGKEAGLEV